MLYVVQSELCPCGSRLQIQTSCVSGHAVCIMMICHEYLSQNLIAAVCSAAGRLVRHESLVHHVLCLGVSAFKKQRPYLLEARSCIRIGIIGLRAAPERYLIEYDAFFMHSSVRHHAEPSVT